MFEELRRRIVMFNIVIVLLFISIAAGTGGDELYTHVFLLIGVVVASLILIIVDGRTSTIR